ncbi:MAG: polysaccharide deacetylase family protein [Planctomycetia bacterium]|nr:polysaccharide deacetylase family protein [Planctomycetia bacterium]
MSRFLLRMVSHFKLGGIIINLHVLPRDQIRTYVETLGRYFEFIHHDELLPRLEHPNGRPFCLLTFDDGKLQHATDAATELFRLGVPAAFYVVTDVVGTERVMWFDQYAELLKQLGRAPHGLEESTIKQLPAKVRDERLARALDRHGVELGLSPDVRSMSWEDARRLAQQGFTIGAHSRTHPILTRESTELAIREIEGSIQAVADEIGECSSFAFPNGNCTTMLCRAAFNCGVTTVMSTEPTWVNARFSVERLPRIQLARSQTPNRIELKVAVAAQRGVLRDSNGKGRRYWKRQRLAERQLRRAPRWPLIETECPPATLNSESEVDLI